MPSSVLETTLHEGEDSSSSTRRFGLVHLCHQKELGMDSTSTAMQGRYVAPDLAS